jgi:hypothetical protein
MGVEWLRMRKGKSLFLSSAALEHGPMTNANCFLLFCYFPVAIGENGSKYAAMTAHNYLA